MDELSYSTPQMKISNEEIYLNPSLTLLPRYTILPHSLVHLTDGASHESRKLTKSSTTSRRIVRIPFTHMGIFHSRFPGARLQYELINNLKINTIKVRIFTEVIFIFYSQLCFDSLVRSQYKVQSEGE